MLSQLVLTAHLLLYTETFSVCSRSFKPYGIFFVHSCLVFDKNSTGGVLVYRVSDNTRREAGWYYNRTITRFSIQTAGLAFGGTGLCSYRVRGVGGSCAEHLTVKSYTVII